MSKLNENLSQFFGETIIKLGYATAGDVDKALKEQKSREERGEKPILIGMLMLEMGMITLTQLVKAINLYREESNFYVSEEAVRIAIHVKAMFSNNDKIISFSSSVAQEGVTSLITQFAIAIALMGEGPILLIDAHPQRPNLHQLLQCAQSPGLFDILEKNIAYQQTLQETALPTLSVMTAGSKPHTSYALFLSEGFRQLLDQLRNQFRFILIDTPPVLEFPDSAVLASLTDGVVLLIAAGKRSKADVVEVKRVLDAVKARLFGYVLSE